MFLLITDCNDEDITVNPDEDEIWYDDIDQIAMKPMILTKMVMDIRL